MLGFSLYVLLFLFLIDMWNFGLSLRERERKREHKDRSPPGALEDVSALTNSAFRDKSLFISLSLPLSKTLSVSVSYVS